MSYSRRRNSITSTKRGTYTLTPTTQGPLYPPSEVVDRDGNFVVVGKLNRPGELGPKARWGAALVRPSPPPAFGSFAPYEIIKTLDDTQDLRDIELFTLPVPLPSNNYPMIFAPEQCPDSHSAQRPSYPLNATPIPDERAEDGRHRLGSIDLGRWLEARGELVVSLSADRTEATFNLTLSGLIPNTVYTVMSLREHDLDPNIMTRPGPLGVPSIFMPNNEGNARYSATLPNAFPAQGNRIINVIVLWMSYHRNYGGAIGHFGLGADVHAQLKLRDRSFDEFTTCDH